jgi:hypothetical protein
MPEEESSKIARRLWVAIYGTIVLKDGLVLWLIPKWPAGCDVDLFDRLQKPLRRQTMSQLVHRLLKHAPDSAKIGDNIVKCYRTRNHLAHRWFRQNLLKFHDPVQQLALLGEHRDAAKLFTAGNDLLRAIASSNLSCRSNQGPALRVQQRRRNCGGSATESGLAR